MAAVLRDADDVPGDAPPSRWRRGPVVAAGLAALVSLVVLLWVAFGVAPRGSADGPVPLIKAEPGPAKLKPESPGGFVPPGKDKLIYDRMAPGQSGKIAERTRPRPEDPVDPPRQVRPAPENKLPTAEPRQPARIEIPTAPKKPATLVEGAASAKRAEISRVPQTAASPGPYRIQVGALRSPDAARRRWSALRAAHGGVLGRLTPTIERVDLGALKGVYFRVQGGPFADASAAGRACAALRRLSISCFVVRD